jgi:hypothetical protein
MGSHWTPPDDQRGWHAQGHSAEKREPIEPRRGPPPPGTVPDFSTGSRTFLVITIIMVSVLIVLTGILAAVLFVR